MPLFRISFNHAGELCLGVAMVRPVAGFVRIKAPNKPSSLRSSQPEAGLRPGCLTRRQRRAVRLEQEEYGESSLDENRDDQLDAMSVPSLSRHHARVLSEIFVHPIARNLEWPDVVSLIEYMGSVLQRHDGSYEFQIGTAKAVFRKPHHKDIEVSDILRLRGFLKEAGIDETGLHAGSGGTVKPQGSHVVLLVDHHCARFFEPQSDGAHLVERKHLEPEDPHGFERHLKHRKEADYKGQRAPEPDEYYERIAQQLKGVDSIVLVGDATGKSSALTYLTQYLEQKHKDVAEHVVAAVQADLSAITVGVVEQIDQRWTQPR